MDLAWGGSFLAYCIKEWRLPRLSGVDYRQRIRCGAPAAARSWDHLFISCICHPGQQPVHPFECNLVDPGDYFPYPGFLATG